MVYIWKRSTWRYDVFTAKLDQYWEEARATNEGILAWETLVWVLNSNNVGVVSSISVFLAQILQDETKQYDFMFYYEKENWVVKHEMKALEESI